MYYLKSRVCEVIVAACISFFFFWLTPSFFPLSYISHIFHFFFVFILKIFTTEIEDIDGKPAEKVSFFFNTTILLLHQLGLIWNIFLIFPCYVTFYFLLFWKSHLKLSIHLVSETEWLHTHFVYASQLPR